VVEDSPHTVVTCSSCSIESPQKFYITPRFEKAKKEHTDAYYETAVRMFSGIDPRLTPFDTLVLDQMVAWVKKPDAFMICGAEKCGNWFGVSKATAQASLNRLEKYGYFRCFKKGNGRGNASKYVLGELYSNGRREWIQEQLLANEYSCRPQNFVRTKPKGKPRGRPFLKGERVQKSATFNNTERVQKSAHKGCKNLLSQPIDQPIHTHTEELPLAFNKENWLLECQKLNPSRDLKDIERTYEIARIEKGAKDGDWVRWVKHYDSFYIPPTGTRRSSPVCTTGTFKGWQKQNKEGLKWPVDTYTSDWEVPHFADCEKHTDFMAWIDAGAPDSYARYKGTPPPYWKKSHDLLAELLKAHKEGKKFSSKGAVLKGMKFKETDWWVALARFKAQTQKAS
jgi:hypothetical protein